MDGRARERSPQRTVDRRSTSGEQGRKDRVRVRLVADPGAPGDLAAALEHDLSGVLAKKVDDATEWVVSSETREIPLDEDGHVPLEALAEEHCDRDEHDILILMTDLPRRMGTRPVATVLVESARCGLVSLPALGALGVRRRAQRAVVHLVRAITGKDHSDDGHPPDIPRLSPLRHVDDDRGTDAHLALVGLRGRLRLLAGMVLDNRPWHLVPHLSSATATAAATAAYAIVTTSFWTMATSLSSLRLLLINIVAILAMAVWLIAYNHLWDRPEDQDAREKAVLYNAATMLTVTIGVTCMYVILYLAGLVAALALIDPGYFSRQTNVPPTFGAYLKLVWLASSVGIVAGALGSSLESEEAVRNATYGRRELARRRAGTSEDGSDDRGSGSG